MNKADNDASTRAIDSLINYEVRLTCICCELFLWSRNFNAISFFYCRLLNISTMNLLKKKNMMSSYRVSCLITSIQCLKAVQLTIKVPAF